MGQQGNYCSTSPPCSLVIAQKGSEHFVLNIALVSYCRGAQLKDEQEEEGEKNHITEAQCKYSE